MRVVPDLALESEIMGTEKIMTVFKSSFEKRD